ncbi:MAG: hypothetical protein KGP28_10970 [Bdellovibrionales bacterium]|nr:hypothetical protein [Bdellovibrionales bacterium]
MKTGIALTHLMAAFGANPKALAGTGPDACNFTDQKGQVWSKVGNASTTGDGYHHERKLDKKLMRAIRGESLSVSSEDFELLLQKLFSSLPPQLQPMNPNGGAPW